MKPVKIYTYSQWRPDFIPIQYETIKRFVKDDFEYIVFNNGVDSPSQRKAVSDECDKIGVRCIDVELDHRLNGKGGVFSFSGNNYLNPNLACSYPLVWSWELMEQQKGCIVAVIDSDMFFMRDYNFNDSIAKGYNFSYVPQYRGISSDYKTSEVYYPWNGFFVVDIDNMPNMSELNWHCGSVKDHRVDVGGQAHFYLEKYDNQITPGFFDIYCVYEIPNEKSIHFTQNGNCNYWLDFIENGVSIRYTEPNPPVNTNVFPYEKPISNYAEIKKEKALYIFNKYIKNRVTYPPPVYIDFMEDHENYLSCEVDPFIIHYKSGSNYNGLSTDYHRQKTDFLRNFLQTI